MAERYTLYAGEGLAGILAGYEANRSGRVNQVAADYMLLVRDLAPTFSAAEWQAIVDVLNGTLIADEAGLKLIWASIADSAEDGIGEKWGVDVESLGQRVRALKLPQLIALREIVARFWVSADGSVDNVALLQQCGAKIAPSGAQLVGNLRGLLTDEEAQAVQAAADELRRK